MAEGRRRKLTLCDKSNVLQTHRLWREVFEEVGKEFPQVEREYAYVDALCMWMVKNPERFDVIVTCNMFGDIITDLGAAIQGGLGLAAGANINPEGVSMFEPIHGSAPKYAGKGVANPIAAILAASLMLQQLGEVEAAQKVEEAVKRLLSSRILRSVEAAKMGKSTQEIGDLVCSFLDGG
jgi:3-isopropylmalate dehydrogenase